MRDRWKGVEGEASFKADVAGQPKVHSHMRPAGVSGTHCTLLDNLKYPAGFPTMPMAQP